MKVFLVLILTLSCSLALGAETHIEAKNLPNSAIWSHIMNSSTSTVFHFVVGDEIEINTMINGDLFKTKSEGVTTIEVQKEFFIRKSSTGFSLSWDGVTYKPYGDVFEGKLSLKAIGTGPTQINGLVIAAELVER